MKKSEINFNDVKMGELVDIDAKVKELLDNKQYEEVIQLMDTALEKEQTSAYYFYRAYARNKISKNWDKIFKLILDDLNKAIAIDNDEGSLYLKFDVIEHYLSIKAQEDDYRYIKDLNEQGEVEYYDKDEVPPNPEQPELDKYSFMMDETINTLIELYPKAEYYVTKFDYYRNNRRENIEKACQLEPNPHIYLRRVDFEIGEGYIDVAKEYISKMVEISNDPEVLFNVVIRLVRLGDNEEACKIIQQLAPFKTSKGTPFLLETQYGTPYLTSRIDILLDINKYSEYARIISLYYQEDPGMDVSLICNLLHQRQFDVVLEYFDCSGSDNQTLLWINGWANFGLGNSIKTKEILCNLDGKKLSFECMISKNDSDDHVRLTKIIDLANSELFSYRFESQADALFSVVPFENIDFDFFIDLILSLFRPETSQTWRWRHKPSIKEDCDLDVNTSALKHDLFQKALQIVIQDMSRIDKPNSQANDELSKTDIEQKLVEIVVLTMLKNRFDIAVSKYTLFENNKIENEAREAERREMMNRLAHNIKGIVSSISFPLERMKREVPDKARKLDEAIRGSNLIREMVNTINYSYNTKIDHIKYDIKHAGSDSGSIYDMLLASLRDSITNILSDKHFSQYRDQYFVSSETHNLALEEWETLFTDPNLVTIDSFARKHLFALDCDIDNSKQYKVGNDMGSYLKLSMMFLEIILNAVKYSAYVPQKDRKVSISLIESESHLIFNVSNRFNPDVKAISTGIGQFIIKNYSLVLDCKPDILIENGVYSLTMKFNNYWR